jgi:phosphoribosylformimino-5-aminoimidazole carboxamide ribonucleotide (ProFAR) isomerase
MIGRSAALLEPPEGGGSVTWRLEMPGHPGVEGAIVGTALYERNFTVAEALNLLKGH